jgi:hypothetical protein
MFGTIRRHQTWLWVIIITFTVVSFVIFGTGSKMGNPLSRSSANYGAINGKPITADEFNNAHREVLINYLMMTGQWPDADPNARRMGFNENEEVYKRLFLISKENELGIQPSLEAVASFAHDRLGKAPLETVEKAIAERGMDAADLERYMRHEFGVRQLLEVAGLSGKLVTPQEAEALYRREHQDLSASMAYFSASNYLDSVTVTPEALTNFYNQRVASYKIPPRRQVDYVRFNVTNYLAKAQSSMTNAARDVESVYQKYGTNAAPGAKTPEEAKAKIKEELVRQSALMEARRDALKFAEELDKLGQKTLASFEGLAKTNGLTMAVSAPFTEQGLPEGLEVSGNFNQAAFGLSAEDPFAGPIQGQDGWYVMTLKQTIPEETPPLKSIEAKVTAEYKLTQAYQKAVMAGLTFANSLTNGLAQGKSFATLAAEAKVKPEALPPFSLNTRSLPPEIEERISFQRLKRLAFSTPDGKASPFTQTQDGGLILYVQSHLPLDEAKVKKELPDYITYIRQVRQEDAFNQWFVKQLQQDPQFFQLLQSVGKDAAQARAGSARAPRS